MAAQRSEACDLRQPDGNTAYGAHCDQRGERRLVGDERCPGRQADAEAAGSGDDPSGRATSASKDRPLGGADERAGDQTTQEPAPRWIAALCRPDAGRRSDYDALETLDEHGSLTPGELGRHLSLTSGSVTALINRLERLGWASRNQHPDDRRKVAVTLTTRAWQVGQDELKPYLKAVDDTARQLTHDERAVVVGFLEDLIDKIAHTPRPA